MQRGADCAAKLPLGRRQSRIDLFQRQRIGHQQHIEIAVRGIASLATEPYSSAKTRCCVLVNKASATLTCAGAADSFAVAGMQGKATVPISGN
jgi:hypothetical protein